MEEQIEMMVKVIKFKGQDEFEVSLNNFIRDQGVKVVFGMFSVTVPNTRSANPDEKEIYINVFYGG